MPNIYREIFSKILLGRSAADVRLRSPLGLLTIIPSPPANGALHPCDGRFDCGIPSPRYAARGFAAAGQFSASSFAYGSPWAGEPPPLVRAGGTSTRSSELLDFLKFGFTGLPSDLAAEMPLVRLEAGVCYQSCSQPQVRGSSTMKEQQS